MASYRTKSLLGNIWEFSGITSDVPQNGSIYFGLTTGLQPTIIESTDIDSSLSSMGLFIYENSVISGGTPLTLNNKSYSEPAGGHTFIFRGEPVVVVLGDILFERHSLGAPISGRSGLDIFILAANSTFIIELKNETNTNNSTLYANLAFDDLAYTPTAQQGL